MAKKLYRAVQKHRPQMHDCPLDIGIQYNQYYIAWDAMSIHGLGESGWQHNRPLCQMIGDYLRECHIGVVVSSCHFKDEGNKVHATTMGAHNAAIKKVAVSLRFPHYFHHGAQVSQVDHGVICNLLQAPSLNTLTSLTCATTPSPDHTNHIICEHANSQTHMCACTRCCPLLSFQKIY